VPAPRRMGSGEERSHPDFYKNGNLKKRKKSVKNEHQKLKQFI
jgi:hypothetical protein